MEMSATEHITEPNIPVKKDSMKYVITICLILTALIFGRSVNNTMFYAFAGVSLVVFLFSSISHCFSLLLFLLPFASILKINVDGMSFFTILFFVFVLRMMIAKKTINTNVFMLLMLFVLFCLCFSGFAQITTIVTMIFGMVMLYHLRTTKINVNSAVIAFSLGIVLSSSLALLKDVFPIVNTFVVDSMLRLDSQHYVVRFAGLQGNPNYYTLDILVVLSVIIVLMYHKSTPRIYTVCLIALSAFGLMSVSKSFLLCWMLLIVFWFVLSIKQGVGNFMKFLMIGIIGCVVVYLYAYDSINAYIFRFIGDSGGTWGSITTGRTNIWKQYIDIIFNDIKIFLFGNGLNTIASGLKGTHNTYLEALFSLGILGTGLLMASIKACMGKIISKPIMWIPVIILFVRMIAIGILTYDNLWLYLAIFVCISRYVATINNEV